MLFCIFWNHVLLCPLQTPPPPAMSEWCCMEVSDALHAILVPALLYLGSICWKTHGEKLAHLPRMYTSHTTAQSVLAAFLGVYQRQVTAIGDATIHHASLSHQRYMACAAMVTNYVRE